MPWKLLCYRKRKGHQGGTEFSDDDFSNDAEFLESSSSDEEEVQEEEDYEIDPTDFVEAEIQETDDNDFKVSENANENTKRKPIQWLGSKTPYQEIPFTANPGLLVNNPGKEPIDFFRLIANDTFFEYLIREMNNYGQHCIAKWSNIDRPTLEKFVAISYLIGHINVPQYKLLWTQDDLYEFPTVSKILSRDRFAAVLRSMHFLENLESSPENYYLFYKIKPLLEIFRSNIRKVYQPSMNLYITRRELCYRPQVNYKRLRLVVRMYNLCDSDGVVLKTICTGPNVHENSINGHTEEIVKTLLQDYTKSGHVIYLEDVYNSPSQSIALLKESTLTVGILRATRQGIPKEMSLAKLKPGDVMSKFTQDGLCILRWKSPKEDILALSTKFDDQIVTVKGNKKSEKHIPKMIYEYKKYMSNVKSAAKKITYYNNENRILRNDIRFGVLIFQYVMNNSFILFNEHSGQKMNLFEFRNAIIRALKGPPLEAPINNPKKEGIHLPAIIEKHDKGRIPRKKCLVCKDKQIRKDVIYYCEECEEKPGLCLNPCFREHHKYYS